MRRYWNVLLLLALFVLAGCKNNGEPYPGSPDNSKANSGDPNTGTGESFDTNISCWAVDDSLRAYVRIPDPIDPKVQSAFYESVGNNKFVLISDSIVSLTDSEFSRVYKSNESTLVIEKKKLGDFYPASFDVNEHKVDAFCDSTGFSSDN